jgi:hypothetical protein
MIEDMKINVSGNKVTVTGRSFRRTKGGGKQPISPAFRMLFVKHEDSITVTETGILDRDARQVTDTLRAMGII